jgi:hypothetical protein
LVTLHSPHSDSLKADSGNNSLLRHFLEEQEDSEEELCLKSLCLDNNLDNKVFSSLLFSEVVYLRIKVCLIDPRLFKDNLAASLKIIKDRMKSSV